MTKRTSFTNTLHSASVGKRMLQGAGLALIAISFFLTGTEPEPHWPQLWLLKPLLIVPAAGALGGVFYYYMDHLRAMGGRQKVAGILLSVVGYVLFVWLGTVLGLTETLWD